MLVDEIIVHNPSYAVNSLQNVLKGALPRSWKGLTSTFTGDAGIVEEWFETWWMELPWCTMSCSHWPVLDHQPETRRRRWRRTGEKTQKNSWGNLMKYNPDSIDDCLYQAVCHGCEALKTPMRSALKCAEVWRQEKWSRLLSAVAQWERVTPATYVYQVSSRRRPASPASLDLEDAKSFEGMEGCRDAKGSRAVAGAIHGDDQESL